MARRVSLARANNAATATDTSLDTIPARPTPTPTSTSTSTSTSSSSPSSSSSLGAQTLVVDAGAYTIKAGFASQTPNLTQDCHVIPNCLARSPRDDKIYIGSQLSTCVDFGEMQFKRPVEKGYIVNWPAESAIWEHSFFDPTTALLACDAHETNLVVTESPNSPSALQRNFDEIIFEHFDFASAYRTSCASLNAFNDTSSLFGDGPRPSPSLSSSSPAEFLLVVDVGHSHTTVTPLLHGLPISPSLKRLTIAGKHLSNYLAELISIRHFSLIDEPHIVSQIKEDCCFVSPNFARDLDITWSGAIGDQTRKEDKEADIVVDYVLPDYETLHRGFMRPHDSSHAAKMDRLGLRLPNASPTSNTATAPRIPGTKEEVFPLSNERFVVPELLFNPSDIGMPESGIPHTILQSLQSIPIQLWQPLLGNIVVVGGTSLIKGFVQRLEADLRMLVSADFVVRVRRHDDPIKASWLGGARMAADRDLLKSLVVTRHDYQEYGAAWVARQFASRKFVNES